MVLKTHIHKRSFERSKWWQPQGKTGGGVRLQAADVGLK